MGGYYSQPVEQVVDQSITDGKLTRIRSFGNVVILFLTDTPDDDTILKEFPTDNKVLFLVVRDVRNIFGRLDLKDIFSGYAASSHIVSACDKALQEYKNHDGAEPFRAYIDMPVVDLNSDLLPKITESIKGYHLARGQYVPDVANACSDVDNEKVDPVKVVEGTIVTAEVLAGCGAAVSIGLAMEAGDVVKEATPEQIDEIVAKMEHTTLILQTTSQNYQKVIDELNKTHNK